MKPLLNVKNLKVRFRRGNGLHTVVKGISFCLNRGKVLGIVGESGSGKSVTALSIMQLLPKEPFCKVSGEINCRIQKEDIDLLQASEDKIRKFRGRQIGMIFQEPMTSLNPVLTCGEQLTETLKLHLKLSKKEAKNTALDYLSKVELKDPLRMYNSYPHQLSGGQKQRVMIAMAICCKPELIIADEPTTALDVTVQKSILQLLKKLQEQLQISVIFITHDLGVIKEIADEVMVMFRGEIVEIGDVGTLFSKPQHAYTKGLLASRPRLDVKLERLPTMSDFIKEDQGEILEKNTQIETLIRSLEVQEYSKPKTQEALSLKVKNLEVCYPGKRNFLGKVMQWTKAVDKVSFEVKKGEVLGLAGESGCGKSSLSRAILQLISAQSGEIWFDGKDLNQLSGKEMRKVRSKIQLIFQDPYSALNPRITVGKAILDPMRLHHIGKNSRERKEKVGELLEKVGLEAQDIYRYPHEFSGGQRQRICIARTLALEPEFIICDESVSALDVSVQAQVLNLLRDLKEEFGFSCIFISHDLSVVKFMSDRIMIMNKGRLEELNTTDEIFNHPQSQYTRKLLNAIPL